MIEPRLKKATLDAVRRRSRNRCEGCNSNKGLDMVLLRAPPKGPGVWNEITADDVRLVCNACNRTSIKHMSQRMKKQAQAKKEFKRRKQEAVLFEERWFQQRNRG